MAPVLKIFELAKDMFGACHGFPREISRRKNESIAVNVCRCARAGPTYEWQPRMPSDTPKCMPCTARSFSLRAAQLLHTCPSLFSLLSG
eukprot:6614221-Prymnesium_polylepis.1